VSRLAAHFAGRHALVTGGSLGIGRAVAQRLVELGAGVTLVARGPGPLEAAAEDLRRRAPRATVRTLALDVSDEAAVAAALPRELAAQPADLLVNGAGISHVGRFLELEPARLREQMDVNYFGAVWVTRAVVPALLDRGRGEIVNVASMAAVVGFHGYAGYAPTKFALYGLSEVLRAELRPAGVRVSIVLPPSVETRMLAHEQASAPPETVRIIESGRVLSAEHVAETLVRGVARGRFEIVPGVENRLAARLARVAPAAARAYVDWLASRP
jgi:3-dehydrosphinganine reductase